MRADIATGGIFPDYELTDHAKHRLSELQGNDLDPSLRMPA
jgi:hypothetical protein